MKKYTLISTLFILMTILLSAFVIAQASPGTRVTVELLSQTPDPVEQGQYVEVRWQVENAGSEGTNDFIFEVLPEYPFSLDPGVPSIQNLGRLGSYQVGDDAFIAYYKLRVDENTLDGSTELKYRYSIDGGKTWTEDSDDIRIEDTNFLISVSSVKTIPSNVAPGQDVTISFDIENLASSTIEDVSVELDLDDASFSPIGISDEIVVGKIPSKEKKTIEFPLAVDADAESKIHKIPVTLTYSSKQGDSYTKEFQVGIRVFEEPEYLANLETTDIYTNKKSGEVVVSISNTGISKMNFLTLELKQSSDYNILSSEKIYIGNLDSDDFETATFNLYIDTNKEEVPLNFIVTYKDEYNNRYSDIQELNLRIYNNNDAIKFGLETPKSRTNIILGIISIVLLTVFWLFMLIDIMKSKAEGYKKILWVVLILFTYAVGAALYYILGRKKKDMVGN